MSMSTVAPPGRGAMRRRPRPEPVKANVLSWLHHRLVDEADLQHSLYRLDYGPLTGALRGSVGRPVHERVGIMVDRYLASSLSRICKDFTICCDYDFDASANAPPTAVIMNRVGEIDTIPMTWTRNRVVVGGTVVSLSASDAGEQLVEAIVLPVASFFMESR